MNYTCNNYINSSSGKIFFELQNNGRVLLLKNALFNPSTQKYHHIKLEHRGYSLFGFDLGGGGRFTGITEDVARQIQKTYGIVSKTLKAEPGGAQFSITPQKTTYYTRGFNWFWGKTSMPLGQNKNDVFLTKEDAALFKSENMTIHDAFMSVLWTDGKKTRTRSDSLSSPSSPRQDQKMDGVQREVKKEEKKVIADLPRISTYKAAATPYEAGYDEASLQERKRRVVAHLDRSSPVPFSAFVNYNRDQRIEEPLFTKMWGALERLAKDPEANDRDAKYMKKLLKHWFRAAYHYLDKNSKPGDGYLQILNEVSKQVSNREKAARKAKELYWRHHATLFWMTFIDLFSKQKIDVAPLHAAISNPKNTSLNPWF